MTSKNSGQWILRWLLIAAVVAPLAGVAFEPSSSSANPAAGQSRGLSDSVFQAEGTAEVRSAALTATDDSYSMTAPDQPGLSVPAPGVLGNDVDASGGEVSAFDTTGMSGTLQLNPNGSFKYTPPSGFTGSTTFTYTVTVSGVSDTATVTITVNFNYLANVDTFEWDLATLGNSFSSGSRSVMDNDAFPAGTTVAPTGTPPADVNCTLASNGRFSCSAKPGGSVPAGQFQFDYALVNGSVNRAVGTVVIEVIDNRTPTATPIATATSTPVTPSATTTPPTPTPTKTATATATATNPPGEPQVTINRNRTTVNTPVKFTITGFAANQDVVIRWRRLTGTVFDVLTVRTDANGNANGQFRVPATPGGPGQEVRFVQGAISKTLAFEVVARIKVTPDPAQRGQTVDVSLRGYARGETVRIRWLKNGVFVQLATVKTSNTGSANVAVVVPSWAADGEHSVRGDGSVFRQQTNVVTIEGGGPVSGADEATATSTPTATPSPEPTLEPTTEPTSAATPEPTVETTVELTMEATTEPSPEPTFEPTTEPSPDATAQPTIEPSPDVDLTPEGETAG